MSLDILNAHGLVPLAVALSKGPITIEFDRPDEIDEKRERCSKLLKPGSPLYQAVTSLRCILLEKYGVRIEDPPRMAPHIEVIAWAERDTFTREEMLARVKELEGRPIELKVGHGKKSIYLETPAVSGYGPTHVTIAYFPHGIVASNVDE